MDLTLVLSTLFAGILTFLAPCTLPLLPAYLGFISGLTQNELASSSNKTIIRRHVLLHATSFVSGFTIVFVSFGLLAGVAGAILSPARSTLTVIGGIIIIIFGLFLLGVFKIPVLNRERRFHLPKVLQRGTPTTSLLLGAAFAFGWTPCIGPILGTVLFFASATETIAAGALLLLVFSIGFAVPFLLLALLIEQAAVFVEKATPYLRMASVIGGLVLVILGTRLIFGDSALTDWFFNMFRYLDVTEAILPYL